MPIFEIDYNQLAQKVKDTLFNEDDVPLTCSLHDILATDESHNCLACNLADYSWGLHNTLKAYALLADQATDSDYILEHHVVFSFFNWLSVMVEALSEIEKIIKIQLIIREDEFKTCTRIIKWTNFFKHPKSMIFVHHPSYTFKEIPQNAEIVIDEEFVFKFYSKEKTNPELQSLISNKTGDKVFVKLPNLFQILEDFSSELNEILELINCGPYRRLLSRRSTIQNYYALPPE